MVPSDKSDISDMAWKNDAKKVNHALFSIKGDSDQGGNYLFDDYFVISNPIKLFLEDKHKKILKAPKGSGKTLFLNRKAYIFKNKKDLGAAGKTFPIDLLGENFLKKEKVTFQNEKIFRRFYMIREGDPNHKIQAKIENFEIAWKYAFVKGAELYCSTLKDINAHEKLKEKSLVADFFHSAMQKPPKELLAELEENNFDEECYIFLDNIDGLAKRDYKNVLGIGDYEFYDIDGFSIWIILQMSFCLAILNFNKKHIHIYGTVRHEALDFLGTKLFPFGDQAKMADIVTELTYTKEDLEKIFYSNISIQSKMQLSPSPFNKVDSIKYFLGLENPKIPNYQIVDNEDKPIQEDIFDYVFRHTLFKPRDIMTIGDRLRQKHISIKTDLEKKYEEIRKAVNEQHREIIGDYLFEINSKLKLDDFYKNISNLGIKLKTIMTSSEVREICCALNSIDSYKTSENPCISCRETHYFSLLYNACLLGTEIKKGEKSIQKFIFPFERTRVVDEVPKLHYQQHKDYYYPHPLLFDIFKPMVNKRVVVGNTQTFYLENTVRVNENIIVNAKLSENWNVQFTIKSDDEKIFEFLVAELSDIRKDRVTNELVCIDPNLPSIAMKIFKNLNLNHFALYQSL